MSISIAGRITLNLVAGIVVTIITVVAAVLWMAEAQNEQAQNNTRTMVTGGIVAMEDNVKAFANDYAWWEAGYNAYMAHDEAWVDANFGSGIKDTQISDILVIISPEGDIPYAWAIDNDHGQPRDIFSPEIRAKIKNLAVGMPVENEAARAGYFRVGNDVLLIAVARIAPVSRASEVDPATLPFLVQGVYLNKTRLHDLGRQFLIEDLQVDLTPTESNLADGFPPIRDFDGKLIGAFVWTPPNPGFVVLRSVAPAIAVGMMVFVLIALWTVLRARRLALSQAFSERQAMTAARRDSLTDLLNRFGFNEFSEGRAFTAACARGEAAIIYLDVNGFKSVNDSIGHQGGDELVKRLAERLAMVMPPDATFARVGGDEFVAALLGPTASHAVAGIASAMVHVLDQSFAVGGFQFQVTAAVGYAVAEGSDIVPAELMRRADLAMYQAKNSAERDAVQYHSGMETGALHKKRLGVALRTAVEAGELSVAYQPIVRTSDLTVISVEALVRWDSPEFGRVSPADFIPVAEETGLIHDIGKFVFQTACQDMAEWPGLKVSINVSPAQLREPNFANDFAAIARRNAVVPNRFKLELTEGLLVRNPTIAKRKLARLKSMGFGLSLDDFGTGFSSIGYLRQFPFDWLKIDKSFVAELGTNPTSNALIQSMIALGDALDIAVVAEGIETAEQLQLLRLLQCEYVQGFHLARPMPASEVTALLARLGDSRKIVEDPSRAIERTS